MDFQRPVVAVIPGVQGRILAVLVETSAELNLRTLARLSGVSVAQASRVMPSLVTLGLVERREAPPSALFRLVRNHVAARAVVALAGAREAVLDELAATAAELDPAPASVVVFGSFARGDADAESDVDVVVARAHGIDEDDDGWRSGLEHWLDNARRLTGNRIEVLEIGEGELAGRRRGRAALWRDVERDGVVVYGASIEQLRGRRGA